jgi:hypothetical protein
VNGLFHYEFAQRYVVDMLLGVSVDEILALHAALQ